MKRIMLLLQFLTLISLSVFSQNGTYKSTIGNYYYSISITMDGTVAHYKLSKIEQDDQIGSGFYMLADITVNETGQFNIPDNGKNYWVIPFSGNEPVTMENCTTGTRECACLAGNGACNPSGEFCRNAGCHECNNICSVGGSAYHVIQGGCIFIYATAIIREE